MDTQPTQQPVTDSFIVKVKLLSNQVYQFTIDPQNTKVSDLKQMILEKINVPIDKQRIIFGAKQLNDDSKVTDYVKQSGLTVHLIARLNEQQNNNTTTTNTQQQPTQQQPQQSNIPQQFPSNNQQTNVNNPFGNILRGMGISGTINGAPIGNPQATTMTFTNMNDLNSSLGGLLGSLGIRLPQQGNVPPNQQNQPRPQTTQATNLFQTPPTNTQRANQNNQPTSSFNANIPQQQVPSNQPQNQQPWHVSNEPILRLNQTISTLDLPSEPVLDNQQLSLREQTAQYLRRLQHQYMRMIPQLNRSIQLLNDGRVTHLNEVLRLFQAIDGANQHAEQSIRRLINLPVNQNQQNQQSTLQRPLPNQQPIITEQSSVFPNISYQGVQINLDGNQEQFVDVMQGDENDLGNDLNNVQATIIIQQNQIDDQIDEQPTVLPGTQNQQQRSTQPNIIGGSINLGSLGGMGGLSSLLQGLTGQMSNNTNGQNNQQANSQQQMIGGLNLGGIMNMFGGIGGINLSQNNNNNNRQSQQSSNTQQIPQQATHVHGPECNHQHSQISQPVQQATQQQVPQQVPQQFPQIDLSNLASMANMFLNPQQQTNSQQQSSNQSSTQSQPQQQNPMGGLMGIFSSLQQSGGMGELLNTSLGETLQQGSQPTIYSTIFKSFTGSDILTCFTSKNFDFLDKKYSTVRQNFLHAISIAGCQQDLVNKVTQDIANLLIPRNNVSNYEECLQQVRTILQRHVSEIVRVTLNRGDAIYSQRMVASLRHAFCQAITKVILSIDQQTLVNGQSAAQLVFQNLKTKTIELMDEFIQGLSGMFYGFIERDLIRVYNEYKEEQKRKQQRSMQQVANEEELLKQIETQSKKDIEYLKNFKHSQFYHPKGE